MTTVQNEWIPARRQAMSSKATFMSALNNSEGFESNHHHRPREVETIPSQNRHRLPARSICGLKIMTTHRFDFENVFGNIEASLLVFLTCAPEFLDHSRSISKMLPSNRLPRQKTGEDLRKALIVLRPAPIQPLVYKLKRCALLSFIRVSHLNSPQNADR
jgi:hypothetical protein